MDRGKEIFRLKVNVGDRFEVISVFEFDEPSVLAQDFSRKHGLSASIEKMIESEIENLIDRLLNSPDSQPKIHDQKKNIQMNDDYTRPDNFSVSNSPLSQEFTLESIVAIKPSAPLHLSDLKSSQNYTLNSSAKYFRSNSPTKLTKKTKNEKKYQFLNIFKYLNPNPLGKLEIANILKINLKARLSKILMPLIIDIELISLPLSYSEFCEKMEILLMFLSNEDKKYLSAYSAKIPFSYQSNHRSLSPSKSLFFSTKDLKNSCGYH